MISTLHGIYFPFLMQFKMSSANCFNLDQSKILLSGSGLILEETGVCSLSFHPSSSFQQYLFLPCLPNILYFDWLKALFSLTPYKFTNKIAIFFVYIYHINSDRKLSTLSIPFTLLSYLNICNSFCKH